MEGIINWVYHYLVGWFGRLFHIWCFENVKPHRNLRETSLKIPIPSPRKPPTSPRTATGLRLFRKKLWRIISCLGFEKGSMESTREFPPPKQKTHKSVSTELSIYLYQVYQNWWQNTEIEVIWHHFCLTSFSSLRVSNFQFHWNWSDKSFW